LVWLGDIGVDGIDTLDYAPVFLWKPGVSENRSHVSPVLACIVDQVSEWSLSEFYAVNSSRLPHNIAYVTCSRATSRPKVQNAVALFDRNFGQPVQDSGS